MQSPSQVSKFSLKHEWQLFLVAIQFLTRIPIQVKNYHPNWLHESSRYFPAVGLLVGLLSAMVLYLATIFFSSLVAAVLSTAFSIKLTGAFHEDGLADTCDGFGGGMTRQRILTIMKDSRIGTYGTLGLVIILLLKVSLLASMPLMLAIIALVIAHTASRLVCISLIVLLPYAGDIEHAKAKPMAQKMTLKQWMASSLWIVFALMMLSMIFTKVMAAINAWQWLGLCILVFMTVSYMYHLLKKHIGGYTGDTLGATQQLTEVAIYAGLAMHIRV